MGAGLRIGDVRAWVFRVARNLWIDSRREHQHYHEDVHAGKGQSARVHCDSAPNPEQQTLYRERIRLMEQVVSRLPKMQRECMRLKCAGLRYHEIAVALDISMTAAVEYVRRAVKRLEGLKDK